MHRPFGSLVACGVLLSSCAGDAGTTPVVDASVDAAAFDASTDAAASDASVDAAPFDASVDAAAFDASVDASMPTDALVASDGGASVDASIGPDAGTTTPVASHGALQVSGNRIVDAHGATYAPRGVSLFWSQWAGEFYTTHVVETLARDVGVEVVRAAMGVDQGGYLTAPDTERAKVVTVVDAAIANGIYVIVDWHDHDASAHVDQARAFFVDMAMRYGNVPNVLFEVWNEPDGESWSTVKAYAEDVVGAIRATGATNLAIVGTPTWSQDVDVAANDPITNRTNVAYTLHFYAATHGAWLRDKATLARSRGIALFVTEWGTCEASGSGTVDLVASQTWLDFLDASGIGYANWSFFDKDESCAALVPSADAIGPWPASERTTSGTFVLASFPRP